MPTLAVIVGHDEHVVGEVFTETQGVGGGLRFKGGGLFYGYLHA
jgi:hypothetical protein